jgi:hypothetical protein
VWSQVKQEVTKKNKIFTFSEVETLMNEELDRVTQERWASCIKHAESLQEEDFAKEIGQDEILEPIVINLKGSEAEYEENDKHDSDITGTGGRYDNNSDDNDTPLAVPLN